jgi:hydroxyethylthiazole kinase-like uncharacterized protein yjeF
MKLVSSAAQVRGLDRRLIEDLGVPGIALMETASRGVAESIRSHLPEAARRGVVVVCGAGNNGGDGFGCARWLHGWGFPVRVWPLATDSKGDAALMRATCRAVGVREAEGLGECGLIVDAIFGTGLDRAVTGRVAEVVAAMNAHGAPIVAVDVPSGMHSDTGAVLGVAVKAVRTITFGRLKPGLLAEPGADLAGDVEVVDIGLDQAGADAIGEVPEAADLAAVAPIRSPGDHKTRSGHLLLVAGSRNMAGAAVLAAHGALAVGVGLLTVAAPRGAYPRLAALPAEAMVLPAGAEDTLEGLPSGALDGRTAVAAGPGLGGGAPLASSAARALMELWSSFEGPVVYDADALPFAGGSGPGERVVTPHPGEAARLLGRSAADVQADRFGAAAALATGRVALLKGRHTLVAAPGAPISVNPANSPVLASGGTGDVLLGMIGGLLARGLSGRDAARLAAWLHGRAAQILESRRTTGWTASDVAGAVPEAWEDLRR